jgi:hypothetical protein
MWSLVQAQWQTKSPVTGQGNIVKNQECELGIFWRLYVEHWIFDYCLEERTELKIKIQEWSSCMLPLSMVSLLSLPFYQSWSKNVNWKIPEVKYSYALNCTAFWEVWWDLVLCTLSCLGCEFLTHILVLWFELRASHLLGRQPIAWATLPALSHIIILCAEPAHSHLGY